MTASEKPVPEHNLPQFIPLLKDTFTLVLSMKEELYGYAAWLLIPCLFFLLPSFVSTPWTEIFLVIANVSFLILSIWVFTVLSYAISFKVLPHAPEKAAKQDEAVSLLAWRAAPHVLWVIILAGLLELLGMAVFIIPGIILTVWFTFAPFEVIFERKGVIEALKSSRELVRGKFFPVLWLILGGTLAFGSGMVVLSIPIYISAQIATGVPMDALLITPPAWLDASVSAIQILFFPLLIAYELLLYFALKSK